jgi:hypothetical protein
VLVNVSDNRFDEKIISSGESFMNEGCRSSAISLVICSLVPEAIVCMKISVIPSFTAEKASLVPSGEYEKSRILSK